MCRLLPDIITFSITLSACENGHDWRHALFLLSAMIATRIEPNFACYGAAAGACDRAGQYRESLSILFYSVISNRSISQLPYRVQAFLSVCATGLSQLQALQIFASQDVNIFGARQILESMRT